jgi:hypothetical protein
MALSLGVRIGSRILVGNHCIEVKARLAPNRIVITVDNGGEILITDEAATAVLPGVKVFAGMAKKGNEPRLAFVAEPAIKIVRVKDSGEKPSYRTGTLRKR